MLDGDRPVGTPFEDVLHPFEMEEPGEHVAVAHHPHTEAGRRQ